MENMEAYEVGTLQKGDPCAVMFPDNRNPWLCRVASSLSYEVQPGLDLLYECLTPYGSIVAAGAVWVRPLTDDELQKLLTLEDTAQKNGVTLYAGRIRL